MRAKGWQSITIRDFVTLQRGHDLPESKRRPGNVPVMGSSGINGYHDTAKAKGPGVTIGRSGVGSFGVANYSPVDYWPHNTVLYVTDFHQNDERFVYYFFKAFDFTPYNSGSAQSSLNRNYLYPVPIQVPPLQTQRKIAAILSAYDDLIENNMRRIEILEEMARSLYREWFVNFRFPGHEQVKMVDSELGLIPEGWDVKKLVELGEIITGKTPSKKVPEYFGDYMPFIKTPDMHGNIFCIQAGEYLSELGVASQKNKIIPANSLCVSCIGTAGIVSITSVISQTNQQINSIILHEQLNREFLYFALRSLKEIINQYGSNGVHPNFAKILECDR